MSTGPEKRRGPIGLFKNSRQFRFAVLALAILPVLYVLSSGPVRSFTWNVSRTHVDTAPGSPAQSIVAIHIPDWWVTVYALLWWVATQPWGEPLVWGYWDLFPISADSPADSFPTNSRI